MRTVAAVTVDRSDWGIYRPVLRRIVEHPQLDLHLIVSGTHLDPGRGETWREIEADGFEIGDRVAVDTAALTPEAIAARMGKGTADFAGALARCEPDLLLLLGDRFLMHAAAVAALPLRIPVAHIHGGELTAGAMDDALRHSITKLSHLHFVATETYARRVRQLGEEDRRITVSGAPSLDNLREVRQLTIAELAGQLGMRLGFEMLLVTFHPETLAASAPAEQVGQLLAALEELELPVVFTGTNADPGGDEIAELIGQYVAGHDDAVLVQHMTTAGYFAMMAMAGAMVGNSSSGIIEAASFGTAVVNVGGRQEGRVRGRNVIDVATDRSAIVAAVQRAVSLEFRAPLVGMVNPYGQGDASRRIVDRLASEPMGEALLRKHFVDRPEVS